MNKLVDQCNNNYHRFTGKKKPVNADYSALSEKIETNPKAAKFKVNDSQNYSNIFSKGYTNHWSREIFIISSVLKTNSSSYEIKD